jgi:hypothetical protein
MSEQSGFIKPSFPRRVLLILPFVVFALISLTAGFVASRTNGLAYKTPFFHLFFSDVLQWALPRI